MNLTSLLCKRGLIGYIPRIKSLGSSGNFFDTILVNHINNTLPKGLHFLTFPYTVVQCTSCLITLYTGIRNIIIKLMQYSRSYIRSYQPFVLYEFQATVDCLRLCFLTCLIPVFQRYFSSVSFDSEDSVDPDTNNSYRGD